MEYNELKVLFENVSDNIFFNRTKAHPMIEEFTRFFTKDLNISLKELNELCSFIEDLFYHFALTSFNKNIELFIDNCKCKMKSSDNLLIRRISKQLEIKEKIEQINSDFV